MIDVNKYKKRLEDEKKKLEEELSSVAERNPADPTDWVATPPTDLDTQADPIDAADDIEDYAERMGLEAPLEEQLKTVNAALAAIEAGTYGQCQVGGSPHPIENERLEVNLSALTCVAHMNG